MLKNVYLLAKIGADTAENERHSAENLSKFATALRVIRLSCRTAAPAADEAELHEVEEKVHEVRGGRGGWFTFSNLVRKRD